MWSPCLEEALASHDRYCVAGGRTEKERRVILRARRLGLPGFAPGQLPPPESPRRFATHWSDAPDATSRQLLRRLQGAACRHSATDVAESQQRMTDYYDDVMGRY